MTSDQVRAFTPLVKACARRFNPAQLPASVGIDDLEAVGWQALLVAWGRFDSARSPSFDGWAWVQMRRAMLSEIRAQKFGPRGSEWSEPESFDDERIGTVDAIHDRVEARIELGAWVASHVRLCECGCGQRTRLAAQTKVAEGIAAGQPRRFVNGHNRRRSPDFSRDVPTSDEVAA